MPFDLGFWKQWEGQWIDSAFPLDRCTDGDDRGAVFETQFKGQPASIQMVCETPAASIEALQLRWPKAASLSHPALVKVLASGDAKLGELRCAYAVMHRADETLADVLAERSLTPDETRDTLRPVLSALLYLQTKGLAPRELKPADIMAFGEQVKISSVDLVDGAGSDAAVLRSFGVLMEEMLGAGRDAPLPEPFAEIARNCQAPDSADLWSLARIEARLRGDRAAPLHTGSRSPRWWGVTAAAAITILGLIAFFWPSQNPGSLRSIPDAPAPVVEPGKEAKVTSGAPKPSPTGRGATTGRAETATQETPVTTLDGVTQVLPEIPQAARKTISGRVRVNIRIRVDSTGRVTRATQDPPQGSKYFATRAIAAAQLWKFPEGNETREWVLRFELTREQTRVFAVKASP